MRATPAILWLVYAGAICSVGLCGPGDEEEYGAAMEVGSTAEAYTTIVMEDPEEGGGTTADQPPEVAAEDLDADELVVDDEAHTTVIDEEYDADLQNGVTTEAYTTIVLDDPDNEAGADGTAADDTAAEGEPTDEATTVSANAMNAAPTGDTAAGGEPTDEAPTDSIDALRAAPSDQIPEGDGETGEDSTGDVVPHLAEWAISQLGNSMDAVPEAGDSTGKDDGGMRDDTSADDGAVGSAAAGETPAAVKLGSGMAELEAPVDDATPAPSGMEAQVGFGRIVALCYLAFIHCIPDFLGYLVRACTSVSEATTRPNPTPRP
jgi:hypothetical protein